MAVVSWRDVRWADRGPSSGWVMDQIIIPPYHYAPRPASVLVWPLPDSPWTYSPSFHRIYSNIFVSQPFILHITPSDTREDGIILTLPIKCEAMNNLLKNCDVNYYHHFEDEFRILISEGAACWHLTRTPQECQIIPSNLWTPTKFPPLPELREPLRICIIHP